MLHTRLSFFASSIDNYRPWQVRGLTLKWYMIVEMCRIRHTSFSAGGAGGKRWSCGVIINVSFEAGFLLFLAYV